MGKTIDYEDLRFYARAALVSYKTPAELKALYHDYAASKPTILDKFFTEANCYPKRVEVNDCGFSYAERNDEVILMFPGTRKEREVFWTDFKTDFDIPVVEATFLGNGNSFFTHRGFLRRFQQLHPEIWRVVQNFGINRKYTVVGHSLGAAIATFVALELKSKGYDAMCVTLAAPKIGDRDFVTLASKLGPKMIRLVRTNDPLPKLSPLKILLQGCGEEVQIDTPNSVWLLVLLGSIASFFLISSSLLSVLITIVLMVIGLDRTHSTESYVRLIDGLNTVPSSRIPENFPQITPKCLPQWYLIIVVTIIAYVYNWTGLGLKMLRAHFRNTVPRKAADRALLFLSGYFGQKFDLKLKKSS